MSGIINLSEPIEFPDMHDGDEIQYTITQKKSRVPVLLRDFKGFLKFNQDGSTYQKAESGRFSLLTI